MKLNKLALLPLAACAVFGTATFADTGKITFKGSVISTGCTPSVDGQGNDGTVTLDPVTKSMFPTAGQTTGEKTFKITLTGCQAGGKKVKAQFSQDNPTDGRLTGSGLGKGWSYQLLAANGNELTVKPKGSGLVNETNDAGATIDASNTGTLTYKVRYYNDGTGITSGDLTALATYVLYLD